MLPFDTETVRIMIRAGLVVVPLAVLHGSFVAEKPHYTQPDVSGHRGFNVETNHDDMFSVAWRARGVERELEQVQSEVAEVAEEAEKVRAENQLRALGVATPAP